MTARASACGKVILLGEHAVVYGRPALAAAIAPGVDAVATQGPGLCLSVSPWGKSFRPDDGSDLGRALQVLGSVLHVTDMHLDATMHLPGGGGLGSSAALGVACLRAAARCLGEALSPERELDLALAWEKVFHGNPSGVDHTLAARGGVGRYVKGEGLQPVRVPERLCLCLADSGERASTRTMVESVARQRARRPEAVDQTFDAIASLVDRAQLALQAMDPLTLGELMNLNQALLASLLVSTERLETLCAAARDAGAFGAKLTGAGGGGCVVAVAGQRSDAVRAAWDALGAPSRVVELGL